MTNPDFTLRLRQYTPLGDPAGIIPDLGLSLVSGPDGPTLTATVSTTIYGALPDDCEVAVEVWNHAQDAWVEGRDSRFVLLTQNADNRDPTGTVTLTGIGLLQWLAGKASLAGVVPYSDGGTVEAAASNTAVHVSGRTFTWSAHVLGVGDRVRVKAKGHSKGLSTGSVYYVRNPTSSTFQLSHTAGGAILSFGSATDVSLERVKTRITGMNGHQFAKNMAVSVLDASGSNLTDGSQYYVVNPTATTIQIAAKPGGTPIELASNTLTVYRYLDGQRVWKNATPGTIIEDAFYEARNRGWGQDASGADQVFHSFTDAGDSNGYAWPARVDDPTVTGVSIGFQPGTPLWTMVQFLLDNGWAEFASHARTFDLFAPNTGTDWSDNAGFVVRIGGTAQQVGVTKDLTEYRTAETVRGEANVEVTATVTRSPWGRLEQYVTASGVGTTSHARSYGYNDLSQHSTPAIGYAVTEAAASADYLPILNYQRGDWVQVQVKGVWTRLRVTQWTLAKDAQGVVTATTLLEKKKRALLHKVAAAARKANGGRVAATTSTTPHESDKRKAAKPSTLTVTARSTSQADKTAKGTVTASWLPVTTDDGGDDLVGAQYEVIVRTNGQQYGKVAAVTSHTTVDLPGYAAGEILGVSVRAISSTGTFGEASDEVEYVVDVPEDLPDAPSTPTVTSTLGSIVIAWDGNLVDATDGPHLPEAADAFAYVAVQRSTDGTTWVTEAQTLAAAGSVTDLGLTVGTTYQYRLQAVSQTGTVSAYSPTASAAVVAVATAQINAAFTAQVTQAASDASAASTAAANAQTAASNAQTAASNAATAAATAQTTANGKNAVTYSTSAASGTPTKDGDLWWRVDSVTGAVTGWWLGSGGAWVAQTLAATVIPNLDAGKITTGFLAAARIAAATITGTMIAGTTITAANIAAATITANEIAGNTITAAKIAANTITAAQLSATAIDAMTITGATFRTASTAQTSGGVQIDSTGLHGYNASGVATFALTTAGALSVTGATVSGAITATSGSVTGTLTVAGAITAGSARLDSTGLSVSPTGSVSIKYGQYVDADATFYGIDFAVDPTGGTSLRDAYSHLGVTSNGSIMTMRSATKLQLKANWDGVSAGANIGDLLLGGDATSGYVQSQAVLARTTTAASLVPGTGAGSGLVSITPSGTLVSLNGTLWQPLVYSDVITTRAVFVSSNGHLGTSASSRRVKDLHQHLKMDDKALDVWLGLPTWEFTYKEGINVAPEDQGKRHHGLVAEEVHDAGFTNLVYYEEREGHEHQGRIEGVAYERMGVYNRMAIQRLYARLMDAEKQISALTRKAAA